MASRWSLDASNIIVNQKVYDAVDYESNKACCMKTSSVRSKEQGFLTGLQPSSKDVIVWWSEKSESMMVGLYLPVF
jgi:hypothetical protein